MCTDKDVEKMGVSGPKLISPNAVLSTNTEPTERGGVDGYTSNFPEKCKSSDLKWGLFRSSQGIVLIMKCDSNENAWSIILVPCVNEPYSIDYFRIMASLNLTIWQNPNLLTHERLRSHTYSQTPAGLHT